jgi:hypothetical protein
MVRFARRYRERSVRRSLRQATPIFIVEVSDLAVLLDA